MWPTAPAARPLATFSQPVTRTRQPIASSTAPAHLLPKTTSCLRQGGNGWSSGLCRCKHPRMSGGMRMRTLQMGTSTCLSVQERLFTQFVVMQTVPHWLPALLLAFKNGARSTL